MEQEGRITGDDIVGVKLEAANVDTAGASISRGSSTVRTFPTPSIELENINRSQPQPRRPSLKHLRIKVVQPTESALQNLETILPEISVDPLEALFGTSRLRVYSERPFLVLARKPIDQRYDYIELLKRILREIYRISWRAPLYAQHVARRLTEYQLAMMRAGTAIYVIDLDQLGSGDAEAERITASSRVAMSLEDRAREAYAQGFGFLVLYASQYMLQSIQRLWEPRIASRGLLYTRLPPPLELGIAEDDAVFELVAAMYGVEYDDIRGASSLVDAVTMAEHRYYSYLESVASDPTLALLARPAVDEEEAKPDEGFIHYAFKMAVLGYLVEAGFDESSIDVEQRMSSTIAVDVLARRSWYNKLAIEVETLYGTGNPTTRLSSVIRDRLAMGYAVWVVVPPLQASIYAPHLQTLIRRYSGVESVEFYTLDMSAGSPVPLEEHLKRLGEIAARLSRARDRLPASSIG